MKSLLSIITCILIWVQPTFAQKVYSEKGIASYYADKFEGRKTANGEIFKNSELTAAHKTLAFGTLVKVTNLSNNKSVVVRINDRGPYAHGRIIDLSKAAAIEIDMLKNGLSEVMVQEVNSNVTVAKMKPEKTVRKAGTYVMSIWGTKRKAPIYGIQLASFKTEEAAFEYGREAHQKGVELPLIKVHKEKDITYFRVMAGDFNNSREAEIYKSNLKELGYKGFVKTYE